MKIAAALSMSAVLIGSMIGSTNLYAKDSPYAKLDMAPEKAGPYTDAIDIRTLCGTKPVRVALSDGFFANSWRKTALAELKDEASKCPTIKEVIHTDAQGSAQKQIADIEGLAAQHVDIILVFPDFGPALIKAMRDATAAGSIVVPYDTGLHFPGERLKDYLVAVTEDQRTKAVAEATWATDALGGKGNFLEFGGVAGNPVTLEMKRGWSSVFDKFPNVKVLEGGPVYVNWDPAETQRVTAGLLAKYPEIDATFHDSGEGTAAALRAFVAAGRPLTLAVTEDVNSLGCLWQEKHATNPKFNVITVSSGTWMVRNALRKALAAAEGLNNTEPSIISMIKYEDTTSKDSKLAPHCDKSLPPDANISSQLSTAQLKALFSK
jgi:ribose transport system substrate-binding protein